ncbi:membrane protein [Streptomyces sp. Tu 6176]|nr:membrane protein [Streptomyces sp. Tu 6176]
MRTAVAVRVGAVALLGAFVLGACSSGGGGEGGDSGSGGAKADVSAGATPSATGGGSTDDGGTGGGGTGGGGAGATDAALSGSWLTTSGGKAVVLIITGRQAALFSTDRTTCTGTATGQAGEDVIRLDACKARSAGTVESVNKTTLRVTWEGGLGKETYTRAEGGALPSGLPTASSGS